MSAAQLLPVGTAGYDGGDAGGCSDFGSPEPAGGSGWQEAGADDGGSGSAGPSSGRAGSGSAASALGGGLSEHAVRWLVEAGTGTGPVTRGAGWAGASHWKFRAQPDPAAAGKPKAAARWAAIATQQAVRLCLWVWGAAAEAPRN